MKREEIHKLLGGYATNSLTPEEREALMAAALEDQSLFDQLVAEEPLRELLAEPVARAHVLAALETAPLPWYRRAPAWLGRPGGMAAAAVAAALLIAATVYVQYEPWHPRPAVLAELRKAEKPFEQPAPTPPSAEALPTPPQLAPAPARRDISDLAARAPAAPGAAGPFASGASGGVVGGVLGGAPTGVLSGKLEVVAGETRNTADAAAAPAPPPLKAAKAAPAVSAEAGSPSARVLFDSQPGQVSFAAVEERLEKRANAAPQATEARKGMAPRTLARPANAPAAAALVPHLGVRYAVLRRAPDGQYAETDPATVFTTGEPLRLLFEPNDSGYLYVLQREAGGGWRQLAGEAVQRRARVQVPSSGALAYEEPGPKELYAIFSRTPEPAFANLQPGVLDQRLRGSLVMQKSADKALYIVNTSSVPQSQQVAFAITLSVRQP